MNGKDETKQQTEEIKVMVIFQFKHSIQRIELSLAIYKYTVLKKFWYDLDTTAKFSL